MLAMLLLPGGDEPLYLALRLLGRFQERQVLFRTIPVVRQNRLRTLPKDATRVDRMKRKLQTKVGKAIYAARKCIVEPGVRADQTSTWFSPILATRKRKSERGVGTGVPDA